MSVYTKKGDKGQTSLFGGTKISKDDTRVSAYGNVDELNSVLGMVYSCLKFDDLKEYVRHIQKKMFVVGAQLASDSAGSEKLKEKINQEDVKYLENIIDKYEHDFGKMKGFELPGETFASSTIHFARTVARRAERSAVTLSKEEYVDPLLLTFLNRLSDTLFILAKFEIFNDFVRKVAERVNLQMSYLNDDMYDKLAKAAEEAYKKINVPVCFAIADPNGDLLYFKRFEGCILISIGIARQKAYTSSVFRMATHELMDASVPGGSLYGINMSDPDVVVFGGGFPLIKDGVQIGSIGVSGGTVEEDMIIGREVLACFDSL